MPAHSDERPEGDVARRSVVPAAASRSLWGAAAWTGVGAAVVCATLGIVVVAVLWMPAAGASGHATSTIRAGLLTFLAALHGGVTVDATSGQFLPLGMTLIVAVTAWRAGSALAQTAETLGERDPVRLAVAGGAQAASFAIASLLAVPLAELGTSGVPFLGVGSAALLLFTVSGGAAFVLSSPLRQLCGRWLPANAGRVARAAAAGVAVYVAAGALLVAGSLAVHHERVQVLAGRVGEGWSGVPILVLGVLAAPNAAIAGAAYLSGPGFTVGTGTSVNAWSAAHGVLPAFPLLGAIPDGRANAAAWGLIVATPLAAGVAVARLAAGADGLLLRLRDAALGSAIAGMAMLVFAWQGGGGIGTGRLATVGASPWQVGLAVFAEIVAVAGLALSLVALWRVIGRRREAEPEDSAAPPEPDPLVAAVIGGDDPGEDESLAG